jgi:hypothetical protein
MKKLLTLAAIMCAAAAFAAFDELDFFVDEDELDALAQRLI